MNTPEVIVWLLIMLCIMGVAGLLLYALDALTCLWRYREWPWQREKRMKWTRRRKW